jgi:hypothetical protein
MTQRPLASCIAFLFLSSSLAIAQSRQQPMTNSDYIRRSRTGRSGNFDLFLLLQPEDSAKTLVDFVDEHKR